MVTGGGVVEAVTGVGVGDSLLWLTQPPEPGREMVGKCLESILMRSDKNTGIPCTEMPQEAQ